MSAIPLRNFTGENIRVPLSSPKDRKGNRRWTTCPHAHRKQAMDHVPTCTEEISDGPYAHVRRGGPLLSAT